MNAKIAHRTKPTIWISGLEEVPTDRVLAVIQAVRPISKTESTSEDRTTSLKPDQLLNNSITDLAPLTKSTFFTPTCTYAILFTKSTTSSTKASKHRKMLNRIILTTTAAPPLLFRDSRSSKADAIHRSVPINATIRLPKQILPRW